MLFVEMFQVAVGGALIALSLVAVSVCVRRSRQGREWDGMQVSAVANAGLGVFLLAYGLPWSGGAATATIVVSAVIGFSAGMVLTVQFARSAKKDPFDG